MNTRLTRNLIDRLRTTPSPPIPAGLEERLLGIAGPAPSRGNRRTFAIAALIGGAMAACVMVAVTLTRDRPVDGVASTQPTPNVIPIRTNHRPQETRPCDIFPPLPPPL